MSALHFPQNLILEDERVRLRPLERGDLPWLVEYSVAEPDLWLYSVISPAGAEAMAHYLDSTLAQRDGLKEYPFAIFDKAQDRYAGSTRFYDIQLGFATTQLGYTWYGKAFQRTGLNRHCKWLLLRYAFETWGMERVEFRADSRNQASLQAMKAIGCVQEGVLRSTSPSVLGGRRNTTVLSVLRSDWNEGVRAHLQGLLR